MRRFSLRSSMPVPRLTLFQRHLCKGFFERMVPPWAHISYKGRLPDPSDLNTPFELVVKHLGVKLTWKLAHQEFVWGQMFVDKQVEGPFKSYRHTHRFLPGEGETSYLEDEIEYEAAYGMEEWFEEKAKKALQYSHDLLRSDLTFLQQYPDTKLKILISGATGLIGSMLHPFLSCAGHEVWTLKRGKELHDKEIYWDPSNGELRAKDLEGFDAIIHLGGASIGSLLWTEETKKKITLSRVHSTWLLSKAISRLQKPPKVFLFASGIGYYGSSFNGVEENSPKGTGFMSDLAADIEKAARSANEACRVIPLRMAAVLTMSGGFLERMLPVAVCYGRLTTGNPNRNLAWVDREDVIRIIYHALFDRNLSGPLNVVAPERTTEGSFWETLRSLLGKKVLFPIPISWIHYMNPVLYKELLAADQGSIQSKLASSEYTFARPTLKSALEYASEYTL